MEYIFICIGTKKIIADSFGPRVGQKLQSNFTNYEKVKVFGTMEKPVHFKNAPDLLKKLKQNYKKQIILIDSAIAKENANIGQSFVNCGGIEIGKAYGKSFYFPGNMNIKTVIGNKNVMPNWSIKQIDILAQKVANQITNLVQVVI